ncbi:MAG: FadR family transcriptional regulator [Bacteroidetes bacterium]|nr:FadR family transcriptional regulator [Bacteroidota bacterium]
MIEPVKKIRLYETITNQLQKLMKQGVLNPGDKLPSERELAEQMHVSRPSIREALRTLEMMGYLESKVGVNGGTFIKQLTINTIISPFSTLLLQNENFIIELLEVRLVLEIEVSRLAAIRRSKEDLTKLKAAIIAMQDEINQGESGFIGDNSFHRALAEATHNHVLEQFVAMCGNLLEIERESHLRQISGESEKALKQHIDIYTSIEEQDEELAQAQMRKHILNISNLIRQTHS